MIVLVGAPGSGKSTVGPLLAERLAVPFTDVDAVIEQRVGRSVAEIFADDGEAVFRAFEEATTDRAARRSGRGRAGRGRRALRRPPGPRYAGTTWSGCRSSAGEAASRVGLNTARPLLLGNVRGRLIAAARSAPAAVRRGGHPDVATDDVPPEVVVDLIVERLERESTVSRDPARL